MTNPHAELNRRIKAEKIAGLLVVALDGHVEDAISTVELVLAEPGLDHMRGLLGSAAGTHPPSRATLGVVLEVLRARQAAEARTYDLDALFGAGT